MIPQLSWADVISALSKMDIEQQDIPAFQKEIRKEYVEMTKELFINFDEKKAGFHLAKILMIMNSQK